MRKALATAVALLFTAAMTLPAATFYLTVAGLGGAPDYDTQFSTWAAEIEKALQVAGTQAKVTTVSGASATREQLQSAINAIARESAPEDVLVLMLIGHGTFDGAEYKFNLPGPDVTAKQLASWLDAVTAKRQLVVNMTSSSGASIQPLAKTDRVVIAATQSGTERNATVFARFWVAALQDSAADSDKSGTVSALEAFRFASDKTAQHYETQKRLATEHAVLDDLARGKGSRAPSAEKGEGRLAASFPLLRLDHSPSITATPEKQQLLARKEVLEEKIDRLKYQKATMPENEYKEQLTALLLDLARTQAELDK